MTAKAFKFITAAIALILITAFHVVYAQTRVTGSVSTVDGKPLGGVSVLVKGTSIGTTTNENGAFSVGVTNLNSTLVFSAVGYASQDLPLSGRNALSVILGGDSRELEQVVVVGYGTQRKANVTGSVATLDMSDVRGQPVTQTSQALQGRISGVTVTQNFGLPGNDAGTIRIRGIGSLSGSRDPLVLIDGVAGSINDVNPNDIESLSVLKDASSAALYGSRAGNGVILITTRHGKKTEAMSLTYNGMVSVQRPTNLPEVVDGLTHMMLKNEEEKNNARAPLFTEAFMQKYKDSMGMAPYFNTNWYDAAMKKSALMHSHNLTFRGGSEKVTSLISLSYLDQDALVEKTMFKRLSLRFNNSFYATRKLTFSLDGFLRREETDNPQDGIGNIFRMMYEIPAIYPAVWDDGTLGEGWNGSNPLGFLRNGARSVGISNRLQLNLKASYAVTNALKLEFAYAPKYLGSSGVSNIRQYTFRRIDGSTGSIPNGLNRVDNSTSRTVENFYQGLVRFDQKFGKHSTSAVAGYEYIDNRVDNFSASRQNFLLPDYMVLSAGDENYKDNNGSASEWALASYFGRFNYAFDNRYLFEVSVRRDGSSRFARDNRWGTFPSASVGWRISEEGFFKQVKLFNSLKLRASYGELGNQEIGSNYPYIGLVSLAQPYYFGGTVAIGAAQTDYPNRIIAWESATVMNAGLDFTLLSNRLSGSLDVYKRKNLNVLHSRDIPGIIGLNANPQNVASLENVGWDLSLGWNDNAGKLNYGVDLVVSDVRNKIVSLNGKPQYGRNAWLENEEFDAFYGYEAIGIYRTSEDLAKYPAANANVKAGDLIFKDQNADGKIDLTNDRKVIGSNIPRLTYGATLRLGYSNFDLSVFMQGVGKKNLYHMNTGYSYGGTYQQYQLGRFNQDDPKSVENATWTRLGGNSANLSDNSFYLYDAAYLRCKNAVLSYNVSPSLLKKLSTNSVRLYVSATNLFTFDKLPINTLDPESPSGTLGANFYPNLRSYTFGVDVKF